jgi:hypothetical protein
MENKMAGAIDVCGWLRSKKRRSTPPPHLSPVPKNHFCPIYSCHGLALKKSAIGKLVFFLRTSFLSPLQPQKTELEKQNGNHRKHTQTHTLSLSLAFTPPFFSSFPLI